MVGKRWLSDKQNCSATEVRLNDIFNKTETEMIVWLTKTIIKRICITKANGSLKSYN